MSLPSLLAPVPLSSEHALDGFDSGEPVLDEWLKRRALKNQGIGVSRCFVVCAEQVVVGYYCLSAGAISHESAPKAMRRNMPDPLPVLLLGRLAIDRRYHNQGLGRALLRDAMLRSLSIAMDSGVFALLVHAMSDPAKRFYLSRGFVASTVQPMTLIMTLQTARLILTEPRR